MQRTPNVAGLPAVQKGAAIKFTVNGNVVEAHEGDTIAAALLSVGIRSFRLSPKRKEPRSLYCGMGICFECLVTVDGVPAVRACITPVTDGMRIETCKEMGL